MNKRYEHPERIIRQLIYNELVTATAQNNFTYVDDLLDCLDFLNDVAGREHQSLT